MDEYKEQVGIMATQLLQGVAGDTKKATEGLRAINQILVQNPKIIPFIADERNRKEFEKLKMPKSANMMEVMSLIGQLQALSKRFHQA